jgi:AraC-like DNA-binding protein
MLFLFIDPASTSTEFLKEQMQRTAGPFGFDHRAGAELAAACRELVIDIGRILELAGVSTREAVDTRIANVVRTIRSDPSAFTRADAVARQLGLSRAHFLHLFGDHTATSFRRYRQWAMMMRAAEVFDEGHDLTRCAVEAGFASPSHFSRTFHSLFGLSATALLLRTEVQLKFATMPALAD